MQSRRHTWYEIGIDFALSLSMNIAGQLLFYGAHATAKRSVTLAILILGLAMPRRYATRHLFHSWQIPDTEQTRWQSWCEVGLDTVLAIGMAFLLQWLIYGAAATWAKAGGLTVVLYLITMARRYVLRRVFERRGSRQHGPLVINMAGERSKTPQECSSRAFPVADTAQQIIQPGKSSLQSSPGSWTL